MNIDNPNIIILTQEQIDAQFDEIKTAKNKLTNISNQLNPILEQFQTTYINYHMNPANNEYEQVFQIANSNMQSLNSKLFSIDSFVIKNIRKLDKSLMLINQQIQKVKKENENLNKNYDQTSFKQNGSAGMIKEFNEIYNREYLKNINLFLGILVSLFITIRLFNQPVSFSS